MPFGPLDTISIKQLPSSLGLYWYGAVHISTSKTYNVVSG